MPYVWDGHDNAARVQETGHGLKLHRYGWSDADLAGALETMITDQAMRQRLAETSTHMRGQSGTEKAARLLDALMREQVWETGFARFGKRFGPLVGLADRDGPPESSLSQIGPTFCTVNEHRDAFGT